ncbi:MAG TPA: glycosyltransferase family 4 protein [Hyphomonadaceae bacterium]
MGFDASRLERRLGARFRDAAKGPAPIRKAAVIGNFPPRKCGIATFTRDAFASLQEQLPGADWTLIAMEDFEGRHDYPPEVTHVIPQDEIGAYVRVADQLNRWGAEVVFIQHEFGIFGGEAGAHLLHLMRRLRMPAIVTLHTVLESPSPAQKQVIDEILQLSSAAIVMTEMGADILARVHNAGPSKVHVIPHGAPERPFASPETFKTRLGLAGHKVLMTFGLLSPNKGLETIIRALPDILQRHPDTLYMIVGATHPHLVARDGETYRESVIALAKSLGVDGSLRFINRFVDQEELADLLQAADVYVTPYLTEAQIVSGTLSYAIALGKPVVSTPYWHAREALADGVGALCAFNDHQSFAREITALLSDQIKREAMARRAYRAGEPSRWRNIADASIDLAVSCRHDYQRKREAAFRALARPKLTALLRITDDCGVMQHSCFSVPDRRHGYCTDDNARALALVARLDEGGDGNEDTTRLAYTTAAFVNHAWNADSGRFRNFMSFSRRWLDDGGSDDCCARSLEALCLTARNAARDDLRDWAANLVRQTAPHIPAWRSLRARALVVRALVKGGVDAIGSEMSRKLISDNAAELMSALADGRRTGRAWFEPQLSYDNARLPEALLLAGIHLDNTEMKQAGLSSLDFIMARQTSAQGCFCPIATSSFAESTADHPCFDQQPIETLATVEACLAAWRATNDLRRAKAAREVFMWFGGDNDHALPVANPQDGGCYDALTAEGVNRNQGAESILAYHLASAAIRDFLRRRPV